MKLLITGCFKYTEEQLEILKKHADVIFVQDEREEITFDVSDIDAVICNGLFLYNDIKKFTNLLLIMKKLAASLCLMFVAFSALAIPIPGAMIPEIFSAAPMRKSGRSYCRSKPAGMLSTGEKTAGKFP